MADTELTAFQPTQRTKSYADLVARFWSKVGPPDENGCRPWLAGKNGMTAGGYGYFALSHNRLTRAHAFAWVLTYGPATPGAVFRHSCDHPWCCEPTHVTPGTQAENIAERDTRGRTAKGDRSGLRVHPERAARGERNGSATLTTEKVIAIRKALASGASQRSIANDFNVVQPTVSRIKRRAKGGWGWLD